MESTKIKLANQLEKEKIIRRLTYKYQGKLLSLCMYSFVCVVGFLVVITSILPLFDEISIVKIILGAILMAALPFLLSLVFQAPKAFFYIRKLSKQDFYYYQDEFSCKEFPYQQEIQIQDVKDIFGRTQLGKKSKEEYKAHRKNPRLLQACLKHPVLNAKGEEMFFGEDRNWVPVDQKTHSQLKIKRDTPMYVVIYGKKVIGFMKEEVDLPWEEEKTPQEEGKKNCLGGRQVSGAILKNYQDAALKGMKDAWFEWIKYVSIFVGVLLVADFFACCVLSGVEKKDFWGMAFVCIFFGVIALLAGHFYIHFYYDKKNLDEFVSGSCAYEVSGKIKQLTKVFPYEWDTASDTNDARINLFLIVEDDEGDELPEVLCRPTFPINKNMFDRNRGYRVGQRVKLLYVKDKGKGQSVIVFG